jgi:hypothetical protein
VRVDAEIEELTQEVSQSDLKVMKLELEKKKAGSKKPQKHRLTSKRHSSCKKKLKSA